MVNAVSMDNVEHAYAVQQLRKSGKNAKIVSATANQSKRNSLQAATHLTDILPVDNSHLIAILPITVNLSLYLEIATWSVS